MTKSAQLLVNLDVMIVLVHVVSINPEFSMDKTGSVAVRDRPSTTNLCDI